MLFHRILEEFACFSLDLSPAAKEFLHVCEALKTPPQKSENSLGFLLSICVCLTVRVLEFVFDLAGCVRVCACDVSLRDVDGGDGKETRDGKTTAWPAQANRTELSL